MNFHTWAITQAGGFFLAEGETPTPRPTFNPENVGPGVESFLIAFILGVALIGLLWSMTRHLRRVQVRAKLMEETEAQQAAESDAASSDTGDVLGAADASDETPGSDEPGPGELGSGERGSGEPGSGEPDAGAGSGS